MTAAEARTHIRYSGWASRRLLNAVEALTTEERAKPMGVSHESIQGTLGHIHFADRIWYKRIVEPDMPMPSMADLSSAEAVFVDWPALQKQWEGWADSLADKDLERMVSFQRLNGVQVLAPASQLINHVVNHATMHRGQVMGMLRQLGLKPPATDLLLYLLQP